MNTLKSQTHLTEEQQIFNSLLIKSLVAAALGVPMFIYSFFGSMEVRSGLDQVIWIIIGIITFAIMWYSGGHFFKSAWQSFKVHRANMYTLIALATGPAWLYSMLVSIWPTLFPEAAREIHYDAPLTIIALIVLGAAIEMRASAKASQKVHALTRLKSEFIDNQTLNTGDTITVEPNSIIPADGEVVEGSSRVNESIFSESRHQERKSVGDTVYAGTVNEDELLTIKVTTPSEDSSLNKVITLLKQAQTSKPSISQIADKIAGIFAPLVLLIAIITPAIWYNVGPEPQITYMLITFMAVLLIACPCALGLATPISIGVGASKASDFGIIFRQGEAIQTSHKLTALLIDHSVLQHTNSAEAKKAIARIQKHKIKVIVLSAQNIELTRQLGQSVGVDNVFSDMTSTKIIEKISELQRRGEIIGFVDTGIQDDALKIANVGFAIGIKAYCSKHADSIILENNLHAVADAIRVSNAILRNIKQNLTGAFLYNALGLPLAAGVFYPWIHTLMSPILAGGLMACSSLFVVLNANRLFLFKSSRR